MSPASCSIGGTADASITSTASSCVSDCVHLNPKNLNPLDWLPSSCAYRLRAAGEPLREWHYLNSGSRETVHEAGQSTRGWTVSKRMRGSSNIMWSTAALKRRWKLALPVPIQIRPMRRARRLRLRFDEATGRLRLTCPRGPAAARPSPGRSTSATGSKRSLPAPAGRAVRPGATIPLAGRRCSIVRCGHPRTPGLVGDDLICGGPEAGLARRVERSSRARPRRHVS